MQASNGCESGEQEADTSWDAQKVGCNYNEGARKAGQESPADVANAGAGDASDDDVVVDRRDAAESESGHAADMSACNRSCKDVDEEERGAHRSIWQLARYGKVRELKARIHQVQARGESFCASCDEFLHVLLCGNLNMDVV